MRLGFGGALVALAGVALCLVDADAEACGGCFAASTEVTVVTDHRMALAVSTQQTVLWDQIRYSGDPREFAWVLPVRDGATIDVAKDEWFSALDTLTQTVVYPPGRSTMPTCLGGCSASSEGYADDRGGAGQSPETVSVLGEKVVGPYESVTLRAIDPDALVSWLGAHGYAIPESVRPVVDAYQREGFDFIAIRLRPGCGVRSMKPVRVTTPGADPTLPLRMVAAGAGASVGLTLYVVSEGRWRPQNFPEARVDDAKIVWDVAQGRSNYAELSRAAMASGGGRAWLAESADGVGGLTGLYYSYCSRPPSGGTTGGAPPKDPCPRADAGADAETDADAGTDADADAETDANATDANAGDAAPDPRGPCAGFDDLDVAMRGLHPGDIWITKLRAELPRSALSEDLRLEPSPSQSAVSSIHTATRAINCPANVGGGRRSRYACSTGPADPASDLGTATLGGLSSFALAMVLRRRRAPGSGRASRCRTPPRT